MDKEKGAWQETTFEFCCGLFAAMIEFLGVLSILALAVILKGLGLARHDG